MSCDRLVHRLFVSILTLSLVVALTIHARSAQTKLLVDGTTAFALDLYRELRKAKLR